MSAAFRGVLERHGLTWTWRCRPSYLAWPLAPVFAIALLVLVLLSLNPQSCKYVYIFQAMFTKRGGPNPWGDDGPAPPPHYNGTWCGWYWNGQLSFEEHYVDGKPEGQLRAWDRLGRLREEASFRAGRYHGDAVIFYENGATNRVNPYFEGKPTGRWIHFYEDGKKYEEKFFSAPGVLDGEETVWNTNGVIKFNHTWQKGEPWDGRFTLPRGTNWFREEYKLGRLLSTTNIGLSIDPRGYQSVAPSAQGPKK